VNDEIFDNWLQTRVDNGTQPPVDSNIHKQRTWDQVIVEAEYNDRTLSSIILHLKKQSKL